MRYYNMACWNEPLSVCTLNIDWWLVCKWLQQLQNRDKYVPASSTMLHKYNATKCTALQQVYLETGQIQLALPKELHDDDAPELCNTRRRMLQIRAVADVYRVEFFVRNETCNRQ
jgi:hypothetical protein